MWQYTYDEVLERMNQARRFGNLPGVEVTKQMLEKLGNPEKGIPYIHVAGTNGKGSVCAFLTSILRKAGKKVGTFTSPHLVNFEERIVVNGSQISKEAVTRFGNQLLGTDFQVTPTMFDLCLVMAILYFKEQQCDIMVIETGLGGRLDSTNALGKPEVCVITKIGYDHTAILGDTLTQIATEKAGIIKAGCPVVIEGQEQEVINIIYQSFCQRNKDQSLFFVVKDHHLAEIEHWRIQISGVHQKENAAAAMLAAKLYLSQSMKEQLCVPLLKAGIEAATWPGRMDILSQNPFFMVDGAHNSNGVKALAQSLREMYPAERFHFIMAVMADKDYEEMIEEILPIAIDFATVTPESERALQAEELLKCIQKKGIPAKAFHSVEECLQNLSPEGKNVAFGSLYFIGEILDKSKGLY